MKILAFLSKWLGQHTPLVVVLTAIFAFFVPHAFSWVHGYSQTAILGLVMLTMGLTLSIQDFRILAERPRDILIGAIAQYTIMPLLAFTLAQVLHLPRAIAVGLLLVGTCPGGVSSNIMTFLCHGDVAFSVGMTTISTLAAPFMTPFLMKILAGEYIAIDTFGMFQSVILVTLAPVALGFALNHFIEHGGTLRHRIKKAYMPLLPGLAVLGLVCIVGGVIAACGKNFITCGIAVAIAVFLHNMLGYLLGYLIGKFSGFNHAKRRTLAIEVGMQNAGLATVLASRHFPSLPEAALASAVSCVWHSLSGALLAGGFNFFDDRRSKLKAVQPR